MNSENTTAESTFKHWDQDGTVATSIGIDYCSSFLSKLSSCAEASTVFKICFTWVSFLQTDHKAPTLSFGDDEEEGEDFKVKKSKASRMIKKMRQAPNVLSSLSDNMESQEANTGDIWFHDAVILGEFCRWYKTVC
jgi:hypothetical protein